MELDFVTSVKAARTVRELYETVPSPVIIGRLTETSFERQEEPGDSVLHDIGSCRLLSDAQGALTWAPSSPAGFEEARRLCAEFEWAAHGGKFPDNFEMSAYNQSRSGSHVTNHLFVNDTNHPRGRHYICTSNQSLRAVSHQDILTELKELIFDPLLNSRFDEKYDMFTVNEDFTWIKSFNEHPPFPRSWKKPVRGDKIGYERLRYVMNEKARPLLPNTVYAVSNLTLLIRDAGTPVGKLDFRANALG